MKNIHEVELDPGYSDDDAEVLCCDDSSIIATEDYADSAEVTGEDHAYFRSGSRGFAYTHRDRFAGELAASGAGLEEAGA